ncbi:MarR family transcriptional regulator [Altererythrobacter sp. CC-YST694]|uniref:MarR family winged helix-turn-helix transcriptional regulator n=1 Tax=Altererythrobacter sp. CC-YST694 TaxID=2755038 RepID=UPI001D0161E3|nr:MarR family transcriptional regulator [Altererythrobacter sp. CC-YST694]MCB5425067.1 MarR family transcriptional regulator [Altererythrobacter sp. CC-YST694]
MSDLEHLVTAYADLYLELMRTVDRRMAEQGASLSRTKLLLCLQKRGALRATDIAEFFNQSPRTVTEAVDGLERDGLVERKPDPEDRRAKFIHVTQKGHEAAAKTEPLRRQLIDQTFGTLTKEEQATMLRLLNKVASNLTKADHAG